MKNSAAGLVLACIATMMLSFGTTYSYLIHRDEAINYFLAGENEIELEEDFKPPAELVPGISFVKKPLVKNTGNLPCFVRMRADFSDSAGKNLCEPLNIDETNWEYNAADEYYYYNKLLMPGEHTSALFTKVTIRNFKSDGVTPLTESDMKEFDILIYAESVHHIDHDGDHPTDEHLTGWR